MTVAEIFLNKKGYEDFNREDMIAMPKIRCQSIMQHFADEQSINFIDWLMTNCELAEDNSLWSYDSEDYTNEKLFEIFKQSEKL